MSGCQQLSWRNLFLGLALFCLCTFNAIAQTADSAAVRGQALDQNGAAITAAQVAIINTATGLRRETQTSGDGYFNVTNLPLTGIYKVSVTANGFATGEREGLELRAGETATINITLRAAGGTAEVDVIGTADGLRTDAQLGTRLDLEKIDNTPIVGRRILNLVLTNSAVRPARGTGDLFLNNLLFVVNGNGRRQTSFAIDGGNGNDSWGRQTIFTNIPVAALQEFTVLSNSASAEYGRTTGAVVNIVTKSGTNDFHGDFIGVARPAFWQANAPSTPAGSNISTKDRLAQVSGVVSGPLKTNRTFFLFGLEYSRAVRDSAITTLLAPGVFEGRYGQTLLLARADHQFNDDHKLTLRANFDRFSDTNPADAVGGNNLPSAARTFRRRTYAAQVSDLAVINSRFVNEARFQFQVGSPITQFEPRTISPQFVRTGNVASVEGESRAATLINHQYQIGDTLSAVFGWHSLKVGGDAIFSSSGGSGQEFGSGFVQGQFTFAANAGCTGLVCVPTSQLTLAQVATYTQSFGNPNYNVREWLSSVFVQDDWRVNRRLSLNLGLRYERQTFTDDKNNFAPRFGYAFDLTGDGKTSLRGSYGIYYSELRANNGAQYALAGATGIFTYSVTPGGLGFPTSFNALPAFPAGAVLPARDITIRPGRRQVYSQFFDVSRLRFYPEKLLNPYTQQATLGGERDLGGHWFLSADYVYAHTIGIDRTLDLNAPAPFIRTAPGQTRSVAAANATRPITPVNSGFRRILATVNEGSSIYHGLQVNLNKRFSQRFSLLASYTWSHTINTVEPDAPGGDPNDQNFLGRFERANSLLDQRHRLALSGWYRLPYRFTTGLFLTAASGRPFNITTGTDANGDGANTDRPVINGVVIPRNTGRTSAVSDVALFLEHGLRLTERAQLSLRGEVFNAFNHTNTVGRITAYGNAATGIPNANFGQVPGGIANVDPGRQFQFHARLRF